MGFIMGDLHNHLNLLLSHLYENFPKKRSQALAFAQT